MRRTAVVPLVFAAVLLGGQSAYAGEPATYPDEPAVYAAESAVRTGTGWEPAPSAPWDVPAGARCDFPVHGEPVVDKVVKRVLDANRTFYTGELVVRVTNTETGAFYDADASGSALVELRADGGQLWTVRGPVLVGVGAGNLPRGLYIVDGAFTLDVSSTGYRTVTLVRGTTDDLCARIG
nr:hypothetical protein [Streptomyces roseirectus]